jgi:hypothetical protein
MSVGSGKRWEHPAGGSRADGLMNEDLDGIIRGPAGPIKNIPNLFVVT